VELLLVRHAVAVPAPAGGEDAARPLSEQGRREFADAVRGLRRSKVRIDLLLHSPMLRAVETADLLARLLAKGGETAVLTHLAEPPSEALLAEVTAERTALVGHQPWMGELCGWLVLGSLDQGERFPFEKGGVARLTGDPRPGAMVLRDLWTPAVLRRLGR
jgi:phosphohistidine phosphatase